MASLELSDDQRQLQDLAREFAAREIRPIAAEVDEADDGRVPWELWEKATEVGLTTYMLPEEFGGGGVHDCLSECVIQEELSHGDGGLGSLVTSAGFFAGPVLALGSSEQQRRYLTRLCEGPRPPLTSLATTEPDFGSDAAGMTTRARRSEGGYVLSGQKTWVSNGGVAELYVVFAQTEPGSRSKGITAFVFELGAEGLRFGPPMKKLGDRGIVNTELFLDDAFASDEQRLGEQGSGFTGLMQTFDRSRVVLASGCVGMARAAFEYAVGYARERVQFGRPIIEHQAVGFRLADVAMRIDAARLLTWQAALRIDAGERATREAAMAKLYASEAAMFATWAAVQTLGGFGYSREYPVEKWFRDAKLEEIWEGTSDIQRLIISRDLARAGA
ncbi:MAG: acyl-CoA dehydrogenase [Gaiellales bacterium]|nr:acyl-CoA dehydrogenase [Gaiellales bacterium]